MKRKYRVMVRPLAWALPLPAGRNSGNHVTWAEICYNAERDGLTATANS